MRRSLGALPVYCMIVYFTQWDVVSCHIGENGKQEQKVEATRASQRSDQH